MPRKHRGPYLPRDHEPVTDKTRTGRVAGLVYGSPTPERVPSSSLSHDYTSGECW